LLFLLILMLPGSSPAQNGWPFARLLPPDSQASSNTQLLAVNSAFNTDFTMRPSVFSTTISPYGAGPQNLQLGIGCINLFTGIPIPNAIIESIVPQTEADTGGHLHDTKRPAGSVTPDHGVTGPATFPILPVAYTAPEASGITDLQVTCSPLSGIPATAIFTIGVEIDGLEPTLNAPSLIIFTSETMHGNNNGYATPETSGALIEMSISYVDQLTQLGVAANNIPPLRIKALSRPQGGLFDYQTEWNTPHKLHRNGRRRRTC
jgi:hypothetical protein